MAGTSKHPVLQGCLEGESFWLWLPGIWGSLPCCRGFALPLGVLSRMSASRRVSSSWGSFCFYFTWAKREKRNSLEILWIQFYCLMANSDLWSSEVGQDESFSVGDHWQLQCVSERLFKTRINWEGVSCCLFVRSFQWCKMQLWYFSMAVPIST